jgi:hypothetical protein
VVCMVEVKRDDLSFEQSEDQMTEYMERVYEHGSFSDDFRGYLVMGQDVVIYGRDANAADPGNPIFYNIGGFSMLDDNDPFTRELSQISVSNWNKSRY